MRAYAAQERLKSFLIFSFTLPYDFVVKRVVKIEIITKFLFWVASTGVSDLDGRVTRGMAFFVGFQ
jgi:hypothetical protein